MRFAECARILQGKRPAGPKMPQTSLWIITTSKRKLEIQLENRPITHAPPGFRQFRGQDLSALTRWLVTYREGLDLQLIYDGKSDAGHSGAPG